jgi:predicted nucleic acid-binding protein
MVVPRFMLDTNCMIAAVSRAHPHHARAADEYNRRLDRGESLVVAAHSLAEAYSVLTRSPPPLRLSGNQAVAVLEGSFVGTGEVIGLDGPEYVALVRSLPTRGIGGLVYDAIIGACAHKANAEVFLTFNERHFRPIMDGRIEIIAPRANDSL